MIVNCFPRPVTIMTVDGVRETYDAGNGNVVRQGADLHEQFLGFRMFARTYEIDLPAPQYGVVYLMGKQEAETCWVYGRHDAIYPLRHGWRKDAENGVFRYVIEGALVFSPLSPYSSPLEPEEEAEA